MTVKKSTILLIVTVICFFLFDQVTKILASHFINPGEVVFKFWGFGLTYTQNYGLVFGIGEELGNIRIISNIVQILFIPFSILYYRYYVSIYRQSRIADFTFILFFAGNLGNLSDSLFLHYVRDFIIWPGPGIPNFADIYANAGIICLLLEAVRNPQIDTKMFFGLKSGQMNERQGFMKFLISLIKKNNI